MSMNDFEVLESLSKHVFKVRRIKDDGIYALKSIRLDSRPQREIQNAINEVRILASIRHPNVISYKEAFYDPNGHALWYSSSNTAS